MSNNIILEASDIHCSYGSDETVINVLRGVSVSVSRGEVAAVTGPSGSGKSTLLHALGLLERPEKGEVMICGESGWSLGSSRRAMLRNRRIGFVFQFHHLLEEFTLLENAAMPCFIAGINRTDSMKRSHNLLQRVGLEHRKDHFPSRVSGGERQRAALARALVMEPDIVFADEPTGNLDSQASLNVQELMMELSDDDGVCFLIATHNRELAAAVHRQYSLEAGLLVASGSPQTG